jgi:hypothetical protein
MTGVGFSPSCTPVSAVSPIYGNMRSDTYFACVAALPFRATMRATSVSGAGFPSSIKIARFRQ